MFSKRGHERSKKWKNQNERGQKVEGLMGVRKKTANPATRFWPKLAKVSNFEGSLEGSVKVYL